MYFLERSFFSIVITKLLTAPTQTSRIDFWRKKLDTQQVVPNCYRSQIHKVPLKCCLLTWRKVSEQFDCCLKMGKKIFLFTFERLHLKQIVSRSFIRS